MTDTEEVRAAGVRIEPMPLELTAARIGGEDGPRVFGPRIDTLHPYGVSTHSLSAWDRPSWGLWLEIRDVAWAMPNWITARVELRGLGGQPVGVRPALIYTGQSDVPVFVNFVYGDEVYAVGIRRYWATYPREGESSC